MFENVLLWKFHGMLRLYNDFVNLKAVRENRKVLLNLEIYLKQWKQLNNGHNCAGVNLIILFNYLIQVL